MSQKIVPNEPIKAYKAFDKNFKCRGFQYWWIFCFCGNYIISVAWNFYFKKFSICYYEQYFFINKRGY